MSAQWLWLLWPLLGLLSWGWFNHIAHKAFRGDSNRSFWNFVLFLMHFGGGPIALGATAIVACSIPRERRWGFRLW